MHFLNEMYSHALHNNSLAKSQAVLLAWMRAVVLSHPPILLIVHLLSLLMMRVRLCVGLQEGSDVGMRTE